MAAINWQDTHQQNAPKNHNGIISRAPKNTKFDSTKSGNLLQFVSNGLPHIAIKSTAFSIKSSYKKPQANGACRRQN